MFKIIRYFIVAVILIECCFIPTSHALSYSFVGGTSVGSVSFLPGSDFDAKAHNSGAGGGLLLGFVVIPKAQFELGVLYLPRGFVFLNKSSSSTQVSLPSLQLPLLFRVFVMPPLSLGLGGYFSYAFSSLGLQGPLRQMDWGLVASLGLQIEILKRVSLITDVRYLYGIHQVHPVGAINTTGALRDYQVLFGFKFGI